MNITITDKKNFTQREILYITICYVFAMYLSPILLFGSGKYGSSNSHSREFHPELLSDPFTILKCFIAGGIMFAFCSLYLSIASKRKTHKELTFDEDNQTITYINYNKPDTDITLAFRELQNAEFLIEVEGESSPILTIHIATTSQQIEYGFTNWNQFIEYYKIFKEKFPDKTHYSANGTKYTEDYILTRSISRQAFADTARLSQINSTIIVIQIIIFIIYAIHLWHFVAVNY